jgi:imidazolonepropionase-like amidohydrolase
MPEGIFAKVVASSSENRQSVRIGRDRNVHTRVLVLLLGVVSACHPPRAPQTPGPVGLALVGVTVIDVETGRLAAERTVLIEGDTITAVVAAGDARLPPGTELVDGHGRFLIPGLWDMHVHLTAGGASDFQRFVAHGVTGVRDMGGNWTTLQDLRDRVEWGEIVGPRMKATGAMVENARWLQAVQSIPEARAYLQANPRLGVGSVDEARAAVDSLVRIGADFVKVRTAPPADAYRALLDEAGARGIPVVGHVPDGDFGMADAIEGGQAGFEHVVNLGDAVDELSSADRRELFRRMARGGVAFTPTLVPELHRLYPAAAVSSIVHDSLGLLDPRRRSISDTLSAFWRVTEALDRYDTPREWAAVIPRALGYALELHEEGVPILAGTDFGARLVYPGASLHDELFLLVELLNLSPLEALQSATLHPARFLGQADAFGTVAPGKVADLVLLDANPLDDIRNVERIHMVILDGRVVTLAGSGPLRSRAPRDPGPGAAGSQR